MFNPEAINFYLSEYKEYFPGGNPLIGVATERIDQQIQDRFHRYSPKVVESPESPGKTIWLVDTAVVVVGQEGNYGYLLQIAERQFGRQLIFDLRAKLPILIARFLGTPFKGDRLLDLDLEQLKVRLPQSAFVALMSR